MLNRTHSAIDPRRDFILNHLRYGNSLVLLKEVYEKWKEEAFSIGEAPGSNKALKASILQHMKRLTENNFQHSRNGLMITGVEFNENGDFQENS